MRSDRLLRAMHKVIHHDLPNEVVVLQSLLQLLEHDETPRLSDDGREYVRRLQNTTRRAGELARFLKEMSKINAFTCKLESVALVDLTNDWQRELPRRYPALQLEFDCTWTAPAIHGDARAFLQAILELCGSVEHPADKASRMTASSRQVGESVECLLEFDDAIVPSLPAALEQRLEFILTRAWLDLCGASVEVKFPAAKGVCFCMVAPNR